MAKTANKASRKMILISLAAVVLVPAVILILVLYFYKETKTARVDGGLYTYFGEVKDVYDGGSTLRQDDQGTTTIKNDGKTVGLNSRPLYENDDNHVLLPYQYVWVDQKQMKMARVEAFTTIVCENGTVTLTDGDIVLENPGGFLFDGIDTYLFLEPVQICYGDETIDTPELSFAVVKYDESLNIYQNGSGEAHLVSVQGLDVTAKLDGASVNLGTDTLSMPNGTWMLLITRPSVLNRIQQEE